jgi:hypothetical protein
LNVDEHVLRAEPFVCFAALRQALLSGVGSPLQAALADLNTLFAAVKHCVRDFAHPFRQGLGAASVRSGAKRRSAAATRRRCILPS